MNAPKLYQFGTGEEMKSRLSQVSPGVYEVGSIDPADVPRYGLVWMMRQPDGSYLPVLRTHSQLVAMSRELPGQLGLKGLSYRGLLRLIVAEFVGSCRATPGVIMVDLASLADHLDAARDPEFWTPERRKRFSDAIAEVH
jgi:hypothetical protein